MLVTYQQGILADCLGKFRGKFLKYSGKGNNSLCHLKTFTQCVQTIKFINYFLLFFLKKILVLWSLSSRNLKITDRFIPESACTKQQCYHHQMARSHTAVHRGEYPCSRYLPRFPGTTGQTQVLGQRMLDFHNMFLAASSFLPANKPSCYFCPRTSAMYGILASHRQLTICKTPTCQTFHTPISNCAWLLQQLIKTDANVAGWWKVWHLLVLCMQCW